MHCAVGITTAKQKERISKEGVKKKKKKNRQTEKRKCKREFKNKTKTIKKEEKKVLWRGGGLRKKWVYEVKGGYEGSESVCVRV